MKYIVICLILIKTIEQYGKKRYITLKGVADDK